MSDAAGPYDIAGLEKLFHAALDRPAEEREAFLDEACRGRPDLRRRVESLLGWDGPELGIAAAALEPGIFCLVFEDPRGDRTVPIPFRPGPTTLGRGAQSDVAVVHPSVSRDHAAFEWRDGRLHVRDAGSKNGVFVNGSQVLESALADGDIVCFGTVRARVLESP